VGSEAQLFERVIPSFLLNFARVGGCADARQQRGPFAFKSM
jgi:hypothetical protein